MLLWRLWKWFLHCITGHCELYRIALSTIPTARKIQPLVKSLKVSRCKTLRDVGHNLGMAVDAESAAETIVRVKHIKIPFQFKFKEHLISCLTLVDGVRQLYVKVENIRRELFDQSNEPHEALLMELWDVLMPTTKLNDRISQQWQDIGFQGNNPATDFRGMGLLGLNTLLYFSKTHATHAKSLLLHSHHPQYWYPYSVVGIDMTSVLYSWLKDGSLDLYLYSTCTQWPPSTIQFMEMFSFVFVKFDSFWISRKPENIMAFNRIKAGFLEELKHNINKGNIIMCL